MAPTTATTMKRTAKGDQLTRATELREIAV